MANNIQEQINNLRDLTDSVDYYIAETLREAADTIERLANAAKTKPDIPTEDVPEFLGSLVDVVEDWLEEKGITPDDIPNDEREGDDGEAIIYGSDYDYFANKFAEIIGIDRNQL